MEPKKTPRVLQKHRIFHRGAVSTPRFGLARGPYRCVL